MLAHDFICVKKDNIPFAKQYYPDEQLLTEEMKHITVKDKWIIKYRLLFENLLLYNKDFGKESNRLVYYGITLIPPESSRVLLKRIKKEGLITRIRLRKLAIILSYSSTNNYFVVHWGI